MTISFDRTPFTFLYITNRTYSSSKKSSIDMTNDLYVTFWNNFYSIVSTHNTFRNESNIGKYQSEVLQMLRDHKEAKGDLSKIELEELQRKIENLTTSFDDVKNLYQSTPGLIKLFISPNEPTAKEFLKSRKLSSNDLLILNQFDQYTLEGIMIYVLSLVFSSLEDYPAVRVSTLIEQLDSVVRLQGSLLESRHGRSIKSDETTTASQPENGVRYSLGGFLVEFLDERRLISLSTEFSFNDKSAPQKKKGQYYSPTPNYAICNFDLSLLPIKYNLPMVCTPLPWDFRDMGSPKSISDLSGGYLSALPGEIYNRHRLLSSHNLSNFYIKLKGNYLVLCGIMNSLQSQSFGINKDFLIFINQNYDLLVQSGLLMPRFLSSLNLKEATDELRKSYSQDPSLMKVCNFTSLLHELMVRVQRARFESFILQLASAYEGYEFYLPAFLDFRGRIYRSGVLHFHERDLSRSLIVFSPNKNKVELDSAKLEEVNKIISSAAAFHYQKFTSNSDAHEWYLSQRSVLNSSSDSLIQFAVGASNPFQFLRDVLCLEGSTMDPTIIPITQDASASAYQLMSYFLLDKEIATRTNLIPSKDGKILDVYTFFLEELRDYLPSKWDRTLSEMICARLTRPLIKRLFMPLVYGKTVPSMANDISDHLSDFLNKRECNKLASLCTIFWRERFPGIVNLMTLVRNVGWLSCAFNTPVYYSIPYFTTVQDYMKMDNVKIWVYDRFHKKRRQVTLRIPTDNRDRRKTEVATFANFIHQKDAWLAMDMIMHMLLLGAPVYTVHDNFITTALHAREVSNLYIRCLCNMDFPYMIINRFINENLVDPTGSRSCAIDVPIPLDEFQRTLEGRIPEGLSKSKKLTYARRISSTVGAYSQYINSIGPYKPEMDNIDERICQFQNDMRRWFDFQNNYSLHL